MSSTVAAERERLGLSQEQLATALGLSSKGHVSDVETGRRSPGIKLALRIEQYFAGRVKAVDLVDPEDAELLRAFQARANTPEPEGAAA